MAKRKDLTETEPVQHQRARDDEESSDADSDEVQV